MTNYLSRFALITALAHLALELCENFLPVVYPTLINAMGLTYAQIGLVALVMTGFGSLTQPLFGYLSDRWGPGRLAVFSIAWSGLVMGLVGFSRSYSMLLVLVALGGLGSAAFHPPGAVLSLVSATKRRGAAASVFSVGGNLGSALSPLLVALGVSWLGLSGTVILIPVALLAATLLFWQLRQYNTMVTHQLHANKSQAETRVAFRNGTLVASLVLITFFVMCRSWFQVGMMTYLPEWIQKQGYSVAFGGQVLTIFLVAVSFGSLTGGALSDYLGRWQVVVLSLLLLSGTQWVFLQSGIVGQVAAIAAMGFLIGASFPVAIVMAQETWPRGVGMASALVMGLGWAPGGLGAWVTGLLADQSSLAFGLQALILPPLLGAMAAVVYAVLHRKQREVGFAR